MQIDSIAAGGDGVGRVGRLVVFVPRTAPGDLAAVREALGQAGIAFDSAELTMVASNNVLLDTESEARKVLRVIDLLEEIDDVQNVYANFDIPDTILELVEA